VGHVAGGVAGVQKLTRSRTGIAKSATARVYPV
jgi:hypothetical protein